MPTSPIAYDKACPKCASPGEAVKATTGQRDLVVVDLRCGQCGHTWAVTIATRTDT